MWAVLFLPVALTAHQGADVSGEPVQEVLILLKRIQASIEKEGQEEAAAYDKFACFCKDEATSKQYAIEKALELESKLTSRVAVNEAEKAKLQESEETLQEQIADIKDDMDTADRQRDWQNYRYGNRSDSIDTGVKAIELAISQTKQKAALLQLRKLRGKQEPAYEYKEQSAEVVKAFEDLRDQFKAERTEIDKDEADRLAKHELLEQSRQAQVDAKESSESAKTLAAASEATAIGADGTDLVDETASRQADQAFLTDLTAKCEAKAQAWDQRSTVRAGELKAMQLAQEALAPAEDTYGATDAVGRKIGVSLSQGGKRHRHRHRHVGEHLAAVRRAVSFVQVEAGSRHAELRERLFAVLRQNTRAAQSAWVRRTTAEVSSALQRGDAFSDVQSMLTDLINALKQEAKDAAAEAKWCESEMGRATGQRDKSVSDLKTLAALTATKSTRRDGLTEDVAGLSFEVANLTKALSEETELRTETAAFNKQRIADAAAGLEAVKDAIDILETYYASVGSPVDPAPLVPEDDDADAAVDAAAPDTGFSNDGYAGNQNSGSFVVAELEKIETTFDGTVTDVTAEEAQEVSDYNDLKDDIDGDISTKNALITRKEGQKTAAVTAIQDAAVDTADSNALLKQTLHEIENLKPACTATLSGADARTAARNQEITVLESAMTILEGGLSFGNQTFF